MKIILEMEYDEAVQLRDQLSRDLDSSLDRGLALDFIKALEVGIADEDRKIIDVPRVFYGVPKPPGNICICWSSGATTPMVVCNDGRHWCHDKEFSG